MMASSQAAGQGRGGQGNPTVPLSRDKKPKAFDEQGAVGKQFTGTLSLHCAGIPSCLTFL